MSTPECEPAPRLLRISWSGLRTHEECKQKGYLTRTGKKAPLDDQRVFFPGNVTDRTVRDWLKHEPEKNPGVMPDMVNTIIDRESEKIREDGGVMRWKDSGDRERVRKECIEAVTKIEPLLQKYVVGNPKVWADYRFEAPIEMPHPDGGTGQVLLIGFMDILTQTAKGNFIVVDVKHTKDSSYWRKTIAQLGFYDLAVELIHGKPAAMAALFQPLCPKPIVPYKPSADSRSQLMQRIVKMAREVWLNDHELKKGTAGCAYCVVRHACPRYAVQPGSTGSGGRISF